MNVVERLAAEVLFLSQVDVKYVPKTLESGWTQVQTQDAEQFKFNDKASKGQNQESVQNKQTISNGAQP